MFRGCSIARNRPNVRAMTHTVKPTPLTHSPIIHTLAARRASLGGQLTAARRWGTGDATSLAPALVGACAAVEIARRAEAHSLDLADDAAVDAILAAARAELTAG